jgi:cell division protein FtsB
MKKIILISILSLFSYTTIFAAITTREEINFLQDESDYNITQRSHIAYLQDESDYNITQRSHIKEYQELSKRQSFWNWLIFG